MSTRRALFFSFLDRYAGLLLAIASSMVVSRLLTPGEIGVFSVTMVLIVFAQSLRDLGAGQYLVQARDLTPQRIRATWTVLLGAGVILGSIVALAALPVAHFYNEPRMADIMWVIAFNFVVNPFGSMTYAWLMREMRFDALAVMRFGSSLVGATTSVWLAWQGWGAISLAFGNLAATLANASLALRYRPPSFGWLPSFRGVREVVGYGSQISANSVIWDFARGAPELFLGKLQGLAAAGLYSRGNGLALMFQRLVLDATQVVAMPLFAKTQHAGEAIAEPFLRSISYITALGWTFLIGLALLSFPMTRLLYGHQWDESVPLTRLLACAAMIGLVASMCIPLLVGTGQARRLLRVTAAVVPMHVASIGIGATYGIVGVGIGAIVAQAISAPIWLTAVKPQVGFTWTALALTLLRSCAVTCIATVAPLSMVAVFGLQPQRPVVVLLSSLAGGAVLFALATRWLKHPIHEELDRLITMLGSRLARSAG